MEFYSISTKKSKKINQVATCDEYWLNHDVQEKSHQQYLKNIETTSVSIKIYSMSKILTPTQKS